MLVARIQLVVGPHRGVTTYARVEQTTENSVCYHPMSDPFRSGAAAPLHSPPLLAGPVPGSDAVLLAPCEPRVVLGMAHNTGAADRLLPPQAFHKSPHSVTGPGRPIVLEAGQAAVDGEAELAVVIGTRARNLTPETALAAVYGYTCANDVTDRAAQASDSLWTEGKSRDSFTPLGPWIRTDLDPADVPVRLSDDQQPGTPASTRGLARGVTEVLVYLTSIMTLHPGDVVLTGAPGPSLRLAPGGISKVTIPTIGELVNSVVLAETASAAMDLVGSVTGNVVAR
jgi:2-keto-4-pentenoate hydratase/2-oxohepta-3-ene-1,7-dioic acid hydratase in catechol pathway